MTGSFGYRAGRFAYGPYSISPEWACQIPVLDNGVRYVVVKRITDLVTASLGLLITAPVMVMVAALVRLDSKGPSLYKGLRVGRRGSLFYQYKFRTMVTNAPDLRNPDGSTLASADDPRVTRLGRILRRTSMDELPQLINILLGEMSLVGPRPDPPDALVHYRAGDFIRLGVTPGLTGWAAVQGRNALPWEQRRDLDIDYVARRCTRLDLRIILLTLRLVLTGRGVNSSGRPQ